MDAKIKKGKTTYALAMCRKALDGDAFHGRRTSKSVRSGGLHRFVLEGHNRRSMADGGRAGPRDAGPWLLARALES